MPDNPVLLQDFPRGFQPLHQTPSYNSDASDSEDLSNHRQGGNQSYDAQDSPPTYQATEASLASTHFYRSKYALAVITFYSAIALFSWIVIVYLSYHPIKGPNFGPWKGISYDREAFKHFNATYNENWYHAARVLQSIAAILAIPVASVICAYAAVVASQQGAKPSHQNLSLRKLMTYADGDWTSPTMYARMLTSRGWRKYGSPFLAAAMLVHVLAILISPIQQIFLSSELIKVPTQSKRAYWLIDIPYLFSEFQASRNTGLQLATSEILQTSYVRETQPQLWLGDCDDSLISCRYIQPNFADISALPDPFFAEPPRDFDTGLIRQFAPRINSTANVTEEPFPADCKSERGAFYRSSLNETYDPEEDPGNFWAIEVCMPAASRERPWKATRNRQDFSEEVYLNISFSDRSNLRIVSSTELKVVVNTTAGYFELPNYLNGGTVGELLESCDGACGEIM